MSEAREVWLLPGMDGTGRLYAPLLDALGDDGRACRVFEHGDAASYDALLDRLPSPTTPTVVVGESFGGPLAIRLASRHADLVRHVILIASFARAPRPFLRVASLGARMLPTPPSWAIELAMLGQGADAALTQAVREAIRSVPPRTTAARVASLASLDVRATVASTSTPVTALVATLDRLVPRALAEEPALLAPRGRVIAIEGPHLLAQARPREVADVIRDLVDR
ncbi:MAG: alpha/beta fold hydrolase [Deltaproteobacteria bacterium]|nr:alpha/beta fold hydrolase [Deltaproteobacteria bacterium]